MIVSHCISKWLFTIIAPSDDLDIMTASTGRSNNSSIIL